MDLDFFAVMCPVCSTLTFLRCDAPISKGLPQTCRHVEVPCCSFVVVAGALPLALRMRTAPINACALALEANLSCLFPNNRFPQIIPLRAEMRNPHNFGKPLGVFNVGMIIVMILFNLVGFIGYLRYGEQVKGSISFNLEPSV